MSTEQGEPPVEGPGGPDDWLPSLQRGNGSRFIRVDPRLHRAIMGLGLTPKQSRVVELITLGMNVSRIARELHIAEATVRTHLRSTYQRMNVSSRVELVARLMSLVLDHHGEDRSTAGAKGDSGPTGASP